MERMTTSGRVEGGTRKQIVADRGEGIAIQNLLPQMQGNTNKAVKEEKNNAKKVSEYAGQCGPNEV